MISQTAEYALRAIVSLAAQPDLHQTNQQLAEVTGVPAGYLSKVMQSLSRAGVVQSQRGLHGGFRLTIPPKELSVFDVIQAVDPIRRIRRCPLGIKSHQNLCPLHRRLEHTAELVEDALRHSTISELLGEANPVNGVPKPLCS